MYTCEKYEGADVDTTATMKIIWCEQLIDAILYGYLNTFSIFLMDKIDNRYDKLL